MADWQASILRHCGCIVCPFYRVPAECNGLAGNLRISRLRTIARPVTVTCAWWLLDVDPPPPPPPPPPPCDATRSSFCSTTKRCQHRKCQPLRELLCYDDTSIADLERELDDAKDGVVNDAPDCGLYFRRTIPPFPLTLEPISSAGRAVYYNLFIGGYLHASAGASASGSLPPARWYVSDEWRNTTANPSSFDRSRATPRARTTPISLRMSTASECRACALNALKRRWRRRKPNQRRARRCRRKRRRKRTRRRRHMRVIEEEAAKFVADWMDGNPFMLFLFTILLCCIYRLWRAFRGTSLAL